MLLQQRGLMDLGLSFLQLSIRTEFHNLLVLFLNSLLCFIALCHYSQLEFTITLLNCRVQLCYFLVLFSQSERQFALFLSLDVLKLSFQALYFSIFGIQFLVFLVELSQERLFRLNSRQVLFSLMPFINLSKPAMNLSIKFGILHLTQDRCIVCFINLENTSALWAFQFFHDFKLLYDTLKLTNTVQSYTTVMQSICTEDDIFHAKIQIST